MNGIEVSYYVNLFIVTLNEPAKTAGFEVDQELFDDIEELLPRNEPILKVEV